MPVQKAKDHYLGKNNLKRLNCAQSVISAFKQRYQVSDREFELFLSHGSGNAPHGVCGAYSVAHYLLEKHHPEKLPDFEKFFCNLAGSLSCREIRKQKKLSCLGCVEKAAEFVATQSKK